MKVVGLSTAACVRSFPLMKGFSNHELVYTLLITASMEGSAPLLGVHTSTAPGNAFLSVVSTLKCVALT